MKFSLKKTIRLIFLLLFVSAVSGFLHEMGHFISSYIYDLSPSLSFKYGGYVSFGEATIHQNAVITAMGPVVTFTLAVTFYFLWRHYPERIILLLFAFWNSVFRLNVIIDRSGSDEYKLTEILNANPYTFETISILLCAVLLVLIVKKQNRFKMKHLFWVVPLGWLAANVAYRVSFELLGLIF